MDIRAERAYAKGQRIEELTQTSFKYTLPNNSFLSNGLYCAACRSFLPSSSVTPSEAYLCGCESVRWCSARCFDGCGWHKYSCKVKGSKLLAQFKAHCRKYNAMGENGAEIFFRLIFNASKVQGRLCPHLLAEEIESFQRDVHSQEVIECAPRNDDIASIYSESYFLLKSVLLFDWRLDESLFDTHLTYDFWLLVLHALHYTFLPIYIEHPDIQRIQSIALLPDTILRHQAFVPYTNQAWMSAKASDPALVAAFTSQPDCPILKERLLVRLLQSLQASDEASNPYISMGYHGIGLPCTLLPHSCLPNTIIDQQTFWSQCDVEINEVLTMSRASVGGKSYEERCDVLRRTFGSSFDCSCSKCIFERSIDRNSFYTSICKDSPPLPIPFFADCPVDLLRIANDYMQNQRFIAVLNTCRLLIRLVSQVLPIATAGIDIGDVYFLMGAALLNMDRWKECQKVWYEGFHLKPGHAGLQREILKSRAYSLSPFHTPSPVLIPTRHCGHCIYQTTAPIVSASGCAEVIQTAESFACSEESSLGGGKGGWSTSRHYAVPSTDIALHRIPALLEWFQSLFASSIHPLLLQHFGDIASGSCFYVHDTFIVKYRVSSAGTSQRYLPLHSDESTHSFILALNSPTDFSGGGTYFTSLGVALPLEAGELLCFPGHLTHGGDPLLEGTRYIIAAFLYLEKENDDRESLVGPLLSFGKEKCSKKDDGVSSPARKRMAARLDDHCVGDIAPLENNYFFSFNFSPELSHDELS